MYDIKKAVLQAAIIVNGLILLLFIISAGKVKSGGGGSVVFLKTTHDFGRIEEGKDPTYAFRFTNLGDSTVTITGVHAICGCTIPRYSKKPVRPGKSGKILVTYHSEGRPGSFRKSIIVSTNGNPPTVKLIINGMVIPKPLKGPDVTKIGGLSFSVGQVNFGDIIQSEWARKTIVMQNDATHPIMIDTVKHPADVQVSYPEFPIHTGEKMNIGVDIRPGKAKTGEYDNIITLKTNDPKKPDKVIYVSAFIIPKRKKHVSGPVLKFDHYYKDLGNVLQGKNENITFHFRNAGDDTLKILQVIPSCGCTVVHLSRWSLAPGKSGTLTMSTDTWSKYGQIQKDVVVKTNDPQQPEHQLVVNFNVISHPDVSSLKNVTIKKGQKAMIFTGKCRSCHVIRGIGKKGNLLYTADCEMCHGVAGKQRMKELPGIPLNNKFLSSVNHKTLYHLIADGTPDVLKKQMMPGFLNKSGGPLTKEQVLSLVKYLKSLKTNKQ